MNDITNIDNSAPHIDGVNGSDTAHIDEKRMTEKVMSIDEFLDEISLLIGRTWIGLENQRSEAKAALARLIEQEKDRARLEETNMNAEAILSSSIRYDEWVVKRRAELESRSKEEPKEGNDE